MKKVLYKIWKVVSNRYVATLIVFAVVFLFLDENNLPVTLKQEKEVKRLHAIEASYEKAIKDDSIQAAMLKNKKENLPAIEKYGRETYYLKAKDEDVFVVSE